MSALAWTGLDARVHFGAGEEGVDGGRAESGRLRQEEGLNDRISFVPVYCVFPINTHSVFGSSLGLVILTILPHAHTRTLSRRPHARNPSSTRFVPRVFAGIRRIRRPRMGEPHH